MPPVGAYSQRLRNCILADTQRVILEFWANDIIHAFDWITMGYVDDPGSMTACHHIADTLIARAGTGHLTTLVSGTDDMAPAIQNIRTGGYIMEIKFATDHSVCLISTLADPYVEIVEGWAGAGPNAYMFYNSVYQDHDSGRILKTPPRTRWRTSLRGTTSPETSPARPAPPRATAEFTSDRSSSR